MSVLTKKQVLDEFKNAKDTDLFCVSCYDKLIKTKEKTLYCSNEMCLNETTYDLKGREVE